MKAFYLTVAFVDSKALSKHLVIADSKKDAIAEITLFVADPKGISHIEVEHEFSLNHLPVTLESEIAPGHDGRFNFLGLRNRV